MALPNDEFWIKKALDLAEEGKGSVSPNPLVGAYIVKNGAEVAKGYHARFGGPHAEIMALKAAGPRARKAILYVTLEPCASWGKTSPCVDAVIRSGIRRVVVGMIDPNPANRLKGVLKMRKAGLEVTTGVLSAAVQEQNRAFHKWVRTGMPFVILKMAQSLDGKIVTFRGESRWISSKASRRFVHRLRFESDAVLIGAGTALKDNPSLTVRLPGAGKHFPDKPWRIVLDPDLRLSPKARLFQGRQLTFRAAQAGTRFLARVSGATHPGLILPVPVKKGQLLLRPLLQQLGSLGIAQLLVEGGGETAWSFLREELVDRICWIIAPKILGGREAKTSVEGKGVDRLIKAFSVKEMHVSRLGDDILVEGGF